MACQIASFLMTLSKFQGHAPVADPVKCDFWYTCSSWQGFNWCRMLHCASVSAELLVKI